MKSVLSLRLLLLFVAALFGASLASAQDLDAVKARMAQRQGAIDALKDRHVAGENTRGFLEARGSVAGADEKTISDENADRRTVYAALAAQTKTDADTVGRSRAQQIALRSKRGVWIQQASGEWVQKG
jgi:uncharacterized protein